MPKAKSQIHAKETLALYMAATRHYPSLMAKCVTLPLSAVISGVVVPLFASHALASLVTHNGHTWELFWWFSASTAIGLALNFVGIRACLQLQAKVMADLHMKVFEHLMARSAGFYNNQIGGKVVSDAIDFVNNYGALFNTGFITGIPFVATTVVGLLVVTISNWIVGAGLSALLLILVVWTRYESKRRTTLRQNRLKITKALTSHLSDSIANAITVKTFAKEAKESDRSKAISDQLRAARITDWNRTVTNENYRMGVLMLAQVLLIGSLIYFTHNNPRLLASGIFAFTYTLTLINRFFNINTITKQVDDALLQASSMTETLQQAPEVIDAPNAKDLQVTKGAIDITDILFHYADNTDQLVFNELSLHIAPGEKIGLVGHSGGGKSTLTRLLLRFEDIAAGSICIDGQNIAHVTQTSLRKHVSYVPQEPLLFHRTIRENIAYGNDTASLHAIKEAAQKAYALDFIEALPQGFDTIVGERGVKLSGGQRQRIAIARAILKEAPILVLDEATSALDSESEKAIQAALQQLMADKTVIVVAHRLSTIQRLDRIIVLDKGKVIENGTHANLLKAKGMYAKLWAHQSGGFIEE